MIEYLVHNMSVSLSQRQGHVFSRDFELVVAWVLTIHFLTQDLTSFLRLLNIQ